MADYVSQLTPLTWPGSSGGGSSAPASSGLATAYGTFAAAAAPQQQAFTNINANLADQGILQNQLTNNAVQSLIGQWQADNTNLGVRSANNAIDMNNINSQIGTNDKLLGLNQADVAARMAQLLRDQGLANSAYGNAADYRNRALQLAGMTRDQMLAYLGGQEGFANQDLGRSLATTATQSAAQRRALLNDAAGRGASSSTGAILGNQDINTLRGLQDAGSRETLARALADIGKAKGDAGLAYEGEANTQNYRLQQAGNTRDSTLSGITAGIATTNDQYQRNQVEADRNYTDLRASWDKMKNLGDSYGVSANQMYEAMSRGITKLGLEGKISAIQIANAIQSNDASAAAAALQVLQMAMANAGGAPAVSYNAPAPVTVGGYTPTYNAGGGVRVM